MKSSIHTFNNVSWIWRKQAADTEHQYVCLGKMN